MNSAFDSCLNDTVSNLAEAGHCITTVGKSFTLTVPSVAEGRLNQLTPALMWDSGHVVYLRRIRSILSLSSLSG